MLEQDYLELCNELKTKYDKFQEEKDDLNRKKSNIIKVLVNIYGLMTILKTVILNIEDLPCICRHLVEFMYNELDHLLFNSDDFDLLSVHSLDIIDL